MSVSTNDIRINGNLVFFNATVAPFHISSPPENLSQIIGSPSFSDLQANSPGFVEGNVLVAILPSAWIVNKLDPENLSCFFKMLDFTEVGPFHISTANEINGFKTAYAPEATRFAIKSIGTGKNITYAVSIGGENGFLVTLLFRKFS